MKLRCCSQLKRPTFSFKASIGDLIGILFLGGFFGGLLFLIGWGIISMMMSSLASGAFWEESIVGRGFSGASYIIALIGVLYAVPKLLHLLSFFINFKLKLGQVCTVCNGEHVVLDLPTKKDPF